MIVQLDDGLTLGIECARLWSHVEVVTISKIKMSGPSGYQWQSHHGGTQPAVAKTSTTKCERA